MALEYPRRISLAQTPSPLQFLERASDRWGHGHRLWVKRDDLTGSTLSGNKVRKLEFICAHALDNGFDTLITCGGIQSNHCRATAFAGAQLGIPVHLILRGEPSGELQGNLLLDCLAGATISCYPVERYQKEQAQLFEHWQDHYARLGRNALAVPTGGSDGLGIWGYIAATQELGEQLGAQDIDRAHIVCATGSGGTQAGLTAGVALHGLAATVWGINVCDNERYFMRKVATDIAQLHERYPHVPRFEFETRVIDGYVGPGYAIAEAPVFELIAELGRLEGLALDPVYTGKAFAGMLQEIEAGRFAGVEDIVFVHTGGIFGVFPQGAEFGFALHAPA